jgi:hypothetical protein
MQMNSNAVEVLLQSRRFGATLREAAIAAGVHVATVCRWQKRDPGLREELKRAAKLARFRAAPPDQPRPHVRWHRDCPLCKARVVVRTAKPELRFWRCGRWPDCPWASWRPRRRATAACAGRPATGPSVARASVAVVAAGERGPTNRVRTVPH